MISDQLPVGCLALVLQLSYSTVPGYEYCSGIIGCYNGFVFYLFRRREVLEMHMPVTTENYRSGGQYVFYIASIILICHTEGTTTGELQQQAQGVARGFSPSSAHRSADSRWLPGTWNVGYPVLSYETRSGIESHPED